MFAPAATAVTTVSRIVPGTAVGVRRRSSAYGTTMNLTLSARRLATAQRVVGSLAAALQHQHHRRSATCTTTARTAPRKTLWVAAGALRRKHANKVALLGRPTGRAPSGTGSVLHAVAAINSAVLIVVEAPAPRV